uniref:HDC16578 n=1 Tax=Drosophila melanogaster TaxID=7227 RepID=Q6IIX9_DROME|nr:TPA_inf: HDC16578 [Drosophila melanogaster]
MIKGKSLQISFNDSPLGRGEPLGIIVNPSSVAHFWHSSCARKMTGDSAQKQATRIAPGGHQS